MLRMNSDDERSSLVAADEAYLGCLADCGLHKHHSVPATLFKSKRCKHQIGIDRLGPMNYVRVVKENRV